MNRGGEDFLWIDRNFDANPFQFGIARHEMPARGRGHRQGWLTVAGLDAGSHFGFGLRRVEEQNVGALGDEGFDAGQCFIETTRGPRVSPGKQQYPGLATGFGSGAATQVRMETEATGLSAVSTGRITKGRLVGALRDETSLLPGVREMGTLVRKLAS